VVGLDKLTDKDRWNVRSQALYEPTQDVTLRLIADHSEIDEACCTVADALMDPQPAQFSR
jgi:iron complex outermembrane receptor protein